jgi:hypothetical protein
MNDESLRRQLRGLSVPSPSEAARGRAKHWALLALQSRDDGEDHSEAPVSWRRGWIGVAFAAVAAIATAIWLRPHDHAENLADDRQVLRQVEELFPNQLNAVVQAGGQTKLSLSDAAEVGSDQPVLLIFKRQKELIRVLSFSGHHVCVPLGSGETCFDVLETTDGGVILEGDKNVMLSSRHPVIDGYAFRAQTLSL